MKPVSNPYARGVMGEIAAEKALTEAGLEVLERRFRGGRGEIDLILLQPGKALVFAEVKAREKASPEEAMAAITPAKQKRLLEAACFYLAKHPEFQNLPLRFDAVTVTPEGVRHIPNAFEPAYD